MAIAPPSTIAPVPPMANNTAEQHRLLADLVTSAGALANRLTLPNGSEVFAKITAQTAVTSEEKQLLLQILTPQKLTPEAKAELRQLLSSPALTLVTLNLPVQGSRALISSLIAQPLAATAIKIKVRPDGQLQILTTEPEETPTQKLSSRAISTLEKTSPKDSLAQLNNPQTKAILQQHLGELLRVSLPKAQNSISLQNLLTKLAAQLPEKSLAQLITEPGVKLLKSLNAQSQKLLTLAAQPGDTSPLKSALKSSGVLLEANLKAALSDTTSLTDKVIATPSDTQAKNSSQDIKALLLTAIQSLNTPAVPAATAPTSNLSDDTLASDDTLDVLLRSLFGGNSAAETTAESSKTAHSNAKFLLQEALLPLLQKTLARIHVQQSQTANALLQEPNLTHLQLDIPLRLPDGYGNLALQIQELPYYATEEETSETATANKEKMRQWRVFMEFDLANLGLLAAQIHWLPQQLRAQLWANNEPLRKKTRSHLADLEAQLKAAGLPLESLICNSDEPPKSTLHLQYALVDVTT